MKKMILLGLLTLAVSTGVGTAARLVVAPPHPAKAPASVTPVAPGGVVAPAGAKVAADDSGATSATAVSATPSPAGASGTTSPSSDSGLTSPTAPKPAVTLPAPAASKTAGPGIELKELGQIVRQMRPADAALLLVHLNDDQVLGIIRGMTVTDAVAMLDALPATRASALRDRLLTDLGKK